MIEICCVFLISLSPTPEAAGICSEFSFLCRNKECVNKVNAECDRTNDCSDNSDEDSCGKNHLSPSRCSTLLNFLKPLKVDLISSLSFKRDYRRAGMSCMLGCLSKKKAPGLDCFIYFILLWKQLLSSLKFFCFFFFHLGLWVSILFFFFLIS